MITKHELSAACRAHDTQASVGKTMPQILEAHNVSAGDAIHVAQQRALRMIIALRGLEPSSEGVVSLTPEESELLNSLSTMWIDGLTTGLAAGGQ